MSQTYKFKSLEIAQKGQEKPKETKADNPNTLTVFETGETRTIDFIQKDGTRQNFAYSHYITAWLGQDKESEKSERYIKIFFATHLITVYGYCLDILYNTLISFSVKSIKVYDIRYLDMVDDNQAFVTGIKVNWRKEENNT
ncbi:hypothetical protein MHTCC0001_09630 [Flavobacteriaceae bacterium MHTCC 0001]